MTSQTRMELQSLLFTAKISGPPAREGAEGLLIQGLCAWDAGDRDQAMGLLRRAAGADMRKPEPWYWIGRLYEDEQDRAGAGQCYYLANDIHRYDPALGALRRLGYLHPDGTAALDR